MTESEVNFSSFFNQYDVDSLVNFRGNTIPSKWRDFINGKNISAGYKRTKFSNYLHSIDPYYGTGTCDTEIQSNQSSSVNIVQDKNVNGFLGITIDCSNLMHLSPININDKGPSFSQYISFTSIYKWVKYNGNIYNVILECPLLMSGRESVIYDSLEQFFNGEYVPGVFEDWVYQWIVIEIISIYMCQFVIPNKNDELIQSQTKRKEVLWIDEHHCFHCQGKTSFMRTLFIQGKNKRLIKVLITDPFNIVLMENIVVS